MMGTKLHKHCSMVLIHKWPIYNDNSITLQANPLALVRLQKVDLKSDLATRTGMDMEKTGVDIFTESGCLNPPRIVHRPG